MQEILIRSKFIIKTRRPADYSCGFFIFENIIFKMKKILILTFLIVSLFSLAQSVKSLRQEAVKAINNNDFSTAKTYYEKILEKGHKTWETYVLLGDCEFKLGNVDAAWNYYQEGLKKLKFKTMQL